MAKRNVMRFIVPVDLDSLSSFNVSARAVIPFYVNPENIQIQDTKLIQKTLTKGGFSVQYWGEDLSTMSVSGTTGSGGIEAAYLLRDVYRHEQIQMNGIILERIKEAQIAAVAASANAEASPDTAYNLIDQLTGGAVSQVVDGFNSVIDAVSNSYSTEDPSIEKIYLTPTAAAFATSIDLYFGGERYRGYFENFSITENAQSPGIINYQFSFVITRRWGTRKNYMPWHRSPRDIAGKPVPASPPSQGAAVEELSFQTRATQQSLTNPDLRSEKDSLNEFVSDEIVPEVNAVPINRSDSTK
jgi:hypothetical protein